MTGALVFGPLADRFGRKTLLVATTAFFGRPAGLDAGARPAGPGGAALPDRPRPRRRHAQRHHADLGVLPAPAPLGPVTLMFCGFTIGSALGGLASAQLLPVAGWRGVLALGGILPLLLVPVLALRLPESLRFLGGAPAPAGAGAGHRAPARPGPAGFASLRARCRQRGLPGARAVPRRHAGRHSAAVGHLLRQPADRLPVSSWTPTLLANIGVPLQRAARSRPCSVSAARSAPSRWAG